MIIVNVNSNKCYDIVKESIQTYVCEDVLHLILSYFPNPLNNENIHQAVKDYLSDDEDRKQQVIRIYGRISNWDVSHVTKMQNLFKDKEYFNESLNKWDVSNVVNMNNMFCRTKHFNKDISNWNVSNVKSMSGMFNGAESFNQPLNNWDVSNVINLVGMYVLLCKSFQSTSQRLEYVQCNKYEIYVL